MMDNNFLSVRGDAIVTQEGNPVYLRGLNIGGWMNMENFIAGYPGHETGLRRAVAAALGDEKAARFFDAFLDSFFAEGDVRFLKELGCTAFRLPLNYRHFEADDAPFTYKETGFERVDEVVAWAARYGIYVILDLHAVQGWQNRGWHADNATGAAHFWGDKGFEDRAVALWETLARRYRDEPWVAGYNVMNEPDTDDARWLNHYYRRVVAAIRAVDPGHIIFLEGNRYSTDFSELEPPFAENLVYSSHLYVPPGLDLIDYPGEADGVVYDRDWVASAFAGRRAFARSHGVPHLMGEFGPIYAAPELEDARLRLMADMIDVMGEAGDHWTIWTYKDVGKMGLVVVDPQSPWMQRTAAIREAKARLRADSWIEREGSPVDALVEQLAQIAAGAAGGALDVETLRPALVVAIQDIVFSRALLPAFAASFAGMSRDEIETMMVESFALENCLIRETLAALLHHRLVARARAGEE
jgi:endoglucanase